MMSTSQHAEPIRDISSSLAPLRKSQSQSIAGFGQLAKAAMADGALTATH